VSNLVGKCENCGQKVLATDSQCWHCGVSLSRPTIQQSPSPSTAVEGDVLTFSLSAFLQYASIIIIIIIAILFVMQSLSRQPLIVTNPRVPRPAGWIPVTDQAQQFTLNIPAEWQWFERSNAAQQSQFTERLNQPSFKDVRTTLEEVDAKINFIMIGSNQAGDLETESIFLVAESTRLRQTSADQVKAIIQEQYADVTEMELVYGITGSIYPSFILDSSTANVAHRCQHQIAPGFHATYWIAICAQLLKFPGYRDEAQRILDSFQPIE
jgi:hypothetical protein